MRSTSPESIFRAKAVLYDAQTTEIVIFEVLKISRRPLSYQELFPMITPDLLALHVANYDPKEGFDERILDIYG